MNMVAQSSSELSVETSTSTTEKTKATKATLSTKETAITDRSSNDETATTTTESTPTATPGSMMVGDWMEGYAPITTSHITSSSRPVAHALACARLCLSDPF